MISIVLSGFLVAAAPNAGGSASIAVSPGADVSATNVIDLSPYAVPAQTVLATMHRVSLDPNSVAAAGVSLNEANAMLPAAAAALEACAQQLTAADEALGAARTNVDSLERSIRAGTAQDTQAAVASLQAARATLAGAIVARDAVLATVIDAAIVNLSSAQKASLTTIRASSSTWGELPPAYRVTASDEGALLALRGALAAKRIALRANEPVPDDATAVLAQWSQNPAVATAIAAQEANAAMIAAAWATAVPAGPP